MSNKSAPKICTCCYPWVARSWDAAGLGTHTVRIFEACTPCETPAQVVFDWFRTSEHDTPDSPEFTGQSGCVANCDFGVCFSSIDLHQTEEERNAPPKDGLVSLIELALMKGGAIETKRGEAHETVLLPAAFLPSERENELATQLAIMTTRAEAAERRIAELEGSTTTTPKSGS